MKRVKVLMNLGMNDFPDSPLTEGEHEVADTFAARLVRMGLAVELPQQPAEVVAEEPPPVVDKFTELRTRHDVAPLVNRDKPKAEPTKAAAKQQPSQKDK